MKVVDYATTVETICFADRNAKVVSEIEEDGTILQTTKLLANSFSYGLTYEIGVVNYNGHVMLMEDGNVDISMLNIEAGDGMQYYTPSSLGVEGDGMEDIKSDTVCLFHAYYAETGNSYIKVKTVREGDAWFTVTYGDVSQKFHLVVKNTNNYPSNVVLDKEDASIQTGETVTLNTSLYPQNAYYKYNSWYVVDSTTGTRIQDAYRIKTEGDRADITFYMAGEYAVYRGYGVSYDYTDSEFISNVCKVTVTGDNLEAPPLEEEPISWVGSSFGSTSDTSDKELRLSVSTSKEKEVTEVTAKIWCEANGKDDLKEYKVEYNYVYSDEDRDVWDLYMYPAEHKEEGVYYADIYGVIEGKKQLIAEDRYLVFARDDFVPSTLEPTPTPLPDGTFYMGDVDMDGKVTASDALSVLKHVVKLGFLEGDAITLADMDSNNEIAASDALDILKVVVKLSPAKTIQLVVASSNTSTE